MANYYSQTRSNYFSVEDETKFRALIAKCVADAEVRIAEKPGPKFAFYCEGNFHGLGADDGSDEFNAQLQSLLVKGEAAIITEIGREAMRYLTGLSTVITTDKIEYLDLSDLAVKKARKLLNNPKYLPDMFY